MKFKKTAAAFAAVITALTLGAAPLSACAPECEHQYKWTVRTEATCISEGLRQGVCGLCSDVKEEVIPVSDEHKYGDWQVTPPTSESEGKAVKVCTLSGEHKLEVTLPVLTEEGTGYASSEITTPSTVTKEGVRTFVLNHEEGDIVFNVAVPMKKIESVYDAVELGASSGSLVRSASGRLNTDTTRYQYYNFMYEYGDNYTHIRSESGANNTELEIWASIDENGDIYAVRTNGTGKPEQDLSATANFMYGYPFTISYAFSQYFYGAEQLLSGLYNWGQLENPNKDFHEEIITSNGVTEYTFGFATYGVLYLSDINVTFTLDDSGAIDTLCVVTNDYDASGWELDPETEVGTITASSPSGIEVIEIKTVLKSSPEGQQVPENPYPKSAFKIKSFDINYGGTVINDETVINVDADSLVHFTVTNIQDNSAGVNDLAYDPLTFWLRTEAGDQPISSVTSSSSENLFVYQTKYQNSDSIAIRSRTTGELNIVVKTTSGSFTKLLRVNVQKIAPVMGQLAPAVYEYGDKAYIWNRVEGATTVYAGKELLFRAEVPSEMQSYVDASISLPTATTVPAGAEDSDYSITESETAQVFKFVAQKAGSYTIRLRSSVNTRIYCNLNINVLEAPDISEMLSGTYSGSVQYPQRSQVSVEFSPESATAGRVTITVGNLGTQTLSYVWDGEKLTTEHSSGRDDFAFSLGINDAYKLVLSHPTGVGEGDVETVVVNRPSV